MKRAAACIVCLGALLALSASAEGLQEGEVRPLMFRAEGPVVPGALALLVQRIPMKDLPGVPLEDLKKFRPFVNLDLVWMKEGKRIVLDTEQPSQPLSLVIRIPEEWILRELKAPSGTKLNGLAFWIAAEGRWYRAEELVKKAPPLPSLRIADYRNDNHEFAFRVIVWPEDDFIIACW
jgi:hypothetical protein